MNTRPHFTTGTPQVDPQEVGPGGGSAGYGTGLGSTGYGGSATREAAWTAEIARYFAVVTTWKGRTLDFFRKYGEQFPSIAVIARTVLAIPGVSVSPESLFSLAKTVVAGREFLSPVLRDKLIRSFASARISRRRSAAATSTFVYVPLPLWMGYPEHLESMLARHGVDDEDDDAVPESDKADDDSNDEDMDNNFGDGAAAASSSAAAGPAVQAVAAAPAVPNAVLASCFD